MRKEDYKYIALPEPVVTPPQSNAIDAHELHFGLYHSLEMGKIKSKDPTAKRGKTMLPVGNLGIVDYILALHFGIYTCLYVYT